MFGLFTITIFLLNPKWFLEKIHFRLLLKKDELLKPQTLNIERLFYDNI